MKAPGATQRFFLAALVAGAAWACQSIPEVYPEREESRALPPSRREELKQALARRFGSPKKPRVPEELDLEAAKILPGQSAFKELCADCHGVLGDGDGLVRDDRGGPRDFRRAVFKYTSTGLPTPSRDDIRRRVMSGLPGTRMPSFEDEDPAQIDAAIEYLIFVAQRGAVERRLIAALEDDDEAAAEELIVEALEEVSEGWRLAAERVLAPSVPFPEASEEQVGRGRSLYLSSQVQCFDCHGEDADGEGRRAEDLKDDWGRSVEPADLTEGEFRGGDRPLDLYHRIAGGIHGTPMPAMRGALSDADIWAIVHFVRSLSADD